MKKKKETFAEKRPFYKKKWFLIMAALILIGAIGGGSNQGGADPQKKTDQVEIQMQKTETAIALEAEEETPPEPKIETDPSGFTNADKAAFQIMTDSRAGKYLNNFKTEPNYNAWTFARFDGEGAVLVSTKASVEGIPEKLDVFYVFTPEFYGLKKSPEKWTTHYLEVGGKIYDDDGYCDEFRRTMQEISEQFSQNESN